MRKFLPAVLLLLVVTGGAGTSIDYENVTVDLEDSSVNVELYVEELTSSTFSYIRSYQVRDVEAKIDGEAVECEVEDLQVGSEIKCETDLRENFTAKLEFKGENFVTKRRGFSTFNYQHSVYRPTDSFHLEVILPAGKGVLRTDNSSTPVVSPEQHDTGTLEGRNIFVSWDIEPELGETLTFQARYESLSGQQDDYDRIILGALGALISLSLAYFGWRIYIREPLESVYEEVDEDQRDVLEVVRENEGQMLQKDIVKQSDYSKAKISGLVKSLVERGVLKKEKEGRSNRLRISKKYHD